MKQNIFKLALVTLLVLFLSNTSAYSATTEELKRQIDLLSEKVDRLKKKSRRTRGTSEDHNKVSMHGYGEMHTKHLPQGGDSNIDNHRFVVGLHAPLSDWIHLNMEIDFEHAAQTLEFEFGHLDFLLSPKLNIKAGVLLMPVGALNEFHEPNRFFTVERPYFQQKVLPSTWTAGGAGIFGSTGSVNYRFYVVNSLQSVKRGSEEDGSGNGNGGCDLQFTGTSGMRSGRGQVNERCFEDLGITGRLEWPMLAPGLSAGASFFAGDTTQGRIEEDGFLALFTADMNYRKGWFEMNSAIANITLDDADKINQFALQSGTNKDGAVGERIFGMNVQAGIHLLQLMGKQTKHDLIVHAMWEGIDTQADLPDCGLTAANAGNCGVNDEAQRDIITYGLSYKPIPKVAIKLDHTHWMYSNQKTKDQISMAVAYMY